MPTKKLTKATIILTIGLFIIGWIVSRPLIDGLTNYLVSLTTNSEIVTTEIGEKFRIYLSSSVAFGLLPIFCFLTVLLLSKAKGIKVSLKGYIVNLIYILVGFVIGGLIRIVLLAKMVKSLDVQYSPQVVNTFPLRLVKFHDWGIIAALIVCGLIFLLVKRKKD